LAAVTDVSVEDAIDFFAMKISEFKAQYLKLRAKQSVCQPNLPKTSTTFTILDLAQSDGSNWDWIDAVEDPQWVFHGRNGSARKRVIGVRRPNGLISCDAEKLKAAAKYEAGDVTRGQTKRFYVRCLPSCI
jgi:hypothetical protein